MKRLRKIISSLHPEYDFTGEERLVDGGILDSLDIVSLVAAIDTEFGVAVPAEEIVPENFNSAQALFDMIRRIDEE